MERKFLNPWAEILGGTNRTPHWEQPGATYFLTLRLADSLPLTLVAQWQEEREAWLRFHPPPWSPEDEQEYHQRFSTAVERWLDDAHGECVLRQREVRMAVATVLRKFDRDRYWHHAWVLMPNHAHLLVSLRKDIALPELLRAWKGTSSRAARLLLGRTASGVFWQKDYFDRLIRDEKHFGNCARYIQRNPEKARLREDHYTLYLSPEVRALIE